MTTPDGSTPAGEGTTPAGAGASQLSETEVTELNEKITALTATVTERDSQLEQAAKSVTDLQAANKKFADDAVSWATTGQQLKDTTALLEESRKTSAGLQTTVDEVNSTNTGLQADKTTRRRQDLMSKYNLPEERVADLDDAALTTLEQTLPHVPSSNAASQTNGGGSGYGIGAGAGNKDMSDLTDFDHAAALIERMKAPK